MKIKSYMIDKKDIYIDIVDNNRECIWHENLSDIPKKDRVPTVEELEAFMKKANIDILKLPEIEEASPALCMVYASTVSSEHNMYSVEKPNEYGDGDWTSIGLSMNEFVEQIKYDIKKYNLESCITKGIGNALFTCYGGLQECFSMPL